MLSDCARVLKSFTPAERRRGVLLVAGMTFMAALEVGGVVSIAPFLAVLGNPDLIESNAWLRAAYDSFGFTDQRSFLIALGAASVGILVIVSALRALVLYAELKFVNRHRHLIGARLLEGYVARPYEHFFKSNSTDLSRSVISEVDEIIRCAVAPTLRLCSYSLLIVALFLLMIAIDSLVTLLALAGIGAVYVVLYLAVAGVLRRIGEDRRQANQDRYRAAVEILSGIKELKVLGRDQGYLEAFCGPSLRFSRRHASNDALSEVPKILAEAAGFTTVILISLYFLIGHGNLGAALPMIGLFAFAGYRLLPALHGTYHALAQLRFIAPALASLARDLEANPAANHLSSDAGGGRLRLRHTITLERVGYSYDGGNCPAIADVTLTIRAGSMTGIIGPSGAGKSTLVDLLLGLLHPIAGRILIDGTPLTEANLRAWQNNIGYVPQHIFLADDTVERNIAFGIETASIDREAVERAARLAQIDHVIRALPGGYATRIGDRGVRLSGGQRQRLGIARALYHDPDILVFDEATNALDHTTENSLLAAIESLAGQKTIIIITHRVATLSGRACLVELRDGRLLRQAAIA